MGKIIPKEEKGWTKDRQHMQDASRPPGMKERFWLCSKHLQILAVVFGIAS